MSKNKRDKQYENDDNVFDPRGKAKIAKSRDKRRRNRQDGKNAQKLLRNMGY